MEWINGLNVLIGLIFILISFILGRIIHASFKTPCPIRGLLVLLNLLVFLSGITQLNALHIYHNFTFYLILIVTLLVSFFTIYSLNRWKRALHDHSA